MGHQRPGWRPAVALLATALTVALAWTAPAQAASASAATSAATSAQAQPGSGNGQPTSGATQAAPGKPSSAPQKAKPAAQKPQPAAPSCPTEPAAVSQADADAQARDRGILWTITRDGHTSYLHASLHLGRPAWISPGPQLKAALDKVDAVALELDPLDTSTWQMPPIPDLPIDAQLQQRLAAQARSVCLPAQALATMHPLLQLSTVTLMRARALGLDVRYGQEMLLSRWAKDRGLPVIALETLQGQLSALLPENPDEARRELRSGLRQLERPAPLQRMLTDLVNTWERGDLRRLARYEDWCNCINDPHDRATLARENDARNPNMAERISELHQKGQSLLVAVGALHMTGPQALPTLLRQHGFEVAQVHPLPGK